MDGDQDHAPSAPNGANKRPLPDLPRSGGSDAIEGGRSGSSWYRRNQSSGGSGGSKADPVNSEQTRQLRQVIVNTPNATRFTMDLPEIDNLHAIVSRTTVNADTGVIIDYQEDIGGQTYQHLVRESNMEWNTCSICLIWEHEGIILQKTTKC